MSIWCQSEGFHGSLANLKSQPTNWISQALRVCHWCVFYVYRFGSLKAHFSMTVGLQKVILVTTKLFYKASSNWNLHVGYLFGNLETIGDQSNGFWTPYVDNRGSERVKKARFGAFFLEWKRLSFQVIFWAKIHKWGNFYEKIPGHGHLSENYHRISML